MPTALTKVSTRTVRGLGQVANPTYVKSKPSDARNWRAADNRDKNGP